MPEKTYTQLSDALASTHSDVTAGKLFGKTCIKTGKKAFAAFQHERMVFKLTGDEHARALGLAGARLWDPSGKGRPMKEWVQLPIAHEALWKSFAEAALAYVAG